MLTLIEVVGTLTGFGIMIHSLFGNGGDSSFAKGFLLMMLVPIITCIIRVIRAKILEERYEAHGWNTNHPDIQKAKKDALSSIARTTYLVGSGYHDVKKTAKYIGHPEHWDEV